VTRLALLLLLLAATPGDAVEAPSKGLSLDAIAKLVDWVPIEARLSVVHAAARGESSWPPLPVFRLLLLPV
jgi:hypothetical protein